MGIIGPQLLGRLFDEHAAALVLYARQWCAEADAEDVVQEAFLSLSQQSVVPDHTSAWLHRVVRNAAISTSRSRKRRLQREARVSSKEAWFSSVDERLDAQSATQLLAHLELEDREVIVARVWGGLTLEQIAQLQGCSVTTTFRRYRHGLAQLHEKLESPCSIPTKLA